MNKVLGGLKLVGLSLILVAAVSVACRSEPAAPLPLETTAASGSASAPVASTTTATASTAPVTAAAAPATAAQAPEAPAAAAQTTEAAQTPQSEGGSKPLGVTSSRSVTSPRPL